MKKPTHRQSKEDARIDILVMWRGPNHLEEVKDDS